MWTLDSARLRVTVAAIIFGLPRKAAADFLSWKNCIRESIKRQSSQEKRSPVPWPPAAPHGGDVGWCYLRNISEIPRRILSESLSILSDGRGDDAASG